MTIGNKKFQGLAQPEGLGMEARAAVPANPATPLTGTMSVTNTALTGTVSVDVSALTGTVTTASTPITGTVSTGVVSVTGTVTTGYQTLTGTVSVTAGTTAVSGGGTTLFLSELARGDTIEIAGEQHVIGNIADNDNLTLSTNHVAGASSVVYYKIAASTAVVGTGTLFTTEFSNGDIIEISGELKTVQSISDNLNLVVNTAFSTPVQGAAYTKRVPTTAVVGVGTLFLTEVSGGDVLRIDEENVTVQSVTDNLNLTLTGNHTGTASGVPARIQAATTKVYGDSTLFSTELNAGDFLDIAGTMVEVASVTSNTELDLTAAYSSYRTGQSVTKHDSEVVGVGTAFLTETSIGCWLKLDETGDYYKVEAVAGNTSLTLESPTPAAVSAYSATSYNPTVTGVGTLFLSEVTPGDYLTLNGESHEVESVSTNLSLTLSTPHIAGATGDTGSILGELGVLWINSGSLPAPLMYTDPSGVDNEVALGAGTQTLIEDTNQDTSVTTEAVTDTVVVTVAGSEAGRFDAAGLGLGTTTPSAQLHQASTSSAEDHVIELASDTQENNPRVVFQRTEGSLASKTAVSNGSLLGSFVWKGWDGSGYESGVSVSAYTTEAWSGAGRGAALDFSLVPSGGTSSVVALTLQEGNVLVPGDLTVNGSLYHSGTSWASRTSAADNTWRAVAYGNNKFVAISASGTGNRVMTSEDGVNWFAQSSAADNDWEDICYGNGLFVAVSSTGSGNRVMTSPDGETWTVRDSPDLAWQGVCYGNGLFVAVASSGTGNRVMTSPDGETWTAGSSASDNDWTAVTYGNGLYVAVAITGTGDRVMTSPDGETWTSRSGANNDWRDVCYGNGQFVAVASSGTNNRVMTSPDGFIWNTQTTLVDNDWYSVTYGEGLYVAVSTTGTGNLVMTSSNGSTWTVRTSAANNVWRGVCFGNGMFVAVSQSGSSNQVMTSGAVRDSIAPDNNTYYGGMTVYGDLVVDGGYISRGINWEDQTSPADNQWYSVCYGNNRFVAVSNTGSGNRVMTSDDGINWETQTSAADNNWLSVCYGHGMFVSVANTGVGNRVMTSKDGITWYTRNSAADNGWREVCYGNGVFVAVGNSGVGNRVMTSTDGIIWETQTSAADNNWTSVTYGNGRFVAVATTGTGNRVMTSDDNGANWIVRTSAADNTWVSVCYGNGVFVAVSSTGGTNQVMTSPDGTTWTLQNTGNSNVWRAVTYGDGLFVAVSSTVTGSQVMTSPDGETWTTRITHAANNWQSICHGNGMFVAVSITGTGDRVMASGIARSPEVPSDNIYQGGMTIRGDSPTTPVEIQHVNEIFPTPAAITTMSDLFIDVDWAYTGTAPTAMQRSKALKIDARILADQTTDLPNLFWLTGMDVDVNNYGVGDIDRMHGMDLDCRHRDGGSEVEYVYGLQLQTEASGVVTAEIAGYTGGAWVWDALCPLADLTGMDLSAYVTGYNANASVDNAHGLRIEYGPAYRLTYTSTIAGDSYGIHLVDHATDTGRSQGTITGTAYGIRVDSMTQGTTATWGFYLQSDDAYFGGNVEVEGQAGSNLNTLTDAATINTDCDDGNTHVVTLTGNRTLANPTNMKPGFTYIWIVKQDGSGSRTLSYGTAFKWPGGTAPTLTTTGGAVDIITGVCETSSVIHVSANLDSK